MIRLSIVTPEWRNTGTLWRWNCMSLETGSPYPADGRDGGTVPEAGKSEAG